MFGRPIGFPLTTLLIATLLAIPAVVAQTLSTTPPPSTDSLVDASDDGVIVGEDLPIADDSGTCAGAACAVEQSSENADCADGQGWGTNNNATHIFVSTLATYTLVTGFEACSVGNWWQEYHGILVVQHAPGLKATAGAYTLDSSGNTKTEYYVVIDSAAGDFELRWMGTQTGTDAECAAIIGAQAPVYRLYDDFPCPLPPPDAPEVHWGTLLA